MRRHFLSIFFLFIIAATSAQQPDLTMVPYREGNKWGYASPDKKIIIKPVFDEAAWFYSGYAAVKKVNRYGYINRSGKLLIPYQFTVAKPFRFGYISNPKTNKEDTVLFAGASLQASGYEICINTKGARMAKCPAINENSVAENRKPDVIIKEKIYSISNDSLFDKVIDDYNVSGSNLTYYVGSKNQLFGLFNNQFEVLLPFEFSMLKRIDAGGKTYLLAQRNGSSGVMNADGSAFIPLENSSLQYITARNGNDYFIVSKEGKTGLKDIAGKDILTQKYAAIDYDGANGFVLTAPGNLKGYYFLNDQLIEPKYNDVLPVAGGRYLLVKTQSGKTGFVNSGGEEFFVD